MVIAFQKTTDGVNARSGKLAVCAKAIEFNSLGKYHIPIQADLVDLNGEEVNSDALIQVVDEKQDAVL